MFLNFTMKTHLLHYQFLNQLEALIKENNPFKIKINNWLKKIIESQSQITRIPNQLLVILLIYPKVKREFLSTLMDLDTMEKYSTINAMDLVHS